jgi:hypothetical protein
MSFPRLVQPVLDRHCVQCHDGTEDAHEPLLTGAQHSWRGSQAYVNLKGYAWALDGRGNVIGRPEGQESKTSRVRSIPGEVGATESLLYHTLTSGVHAEEVKMTDEEWERITTWLDCFSPFFGAYEDPEAQIEGERVMPQLQ